MQEFKIGGKITLEDDVSYRIIDMVNEDGKEYLICCTTQKTILPIVFEKVKYNNEIFLRKEENPIIIKKIVVQSLKK